MIISKEFVFGFIRAFIPTNLETDCAKINVDRYRCHYFSKAPTNREKFPTSRVRSSGTGTCMVRPKIDHLVGGRPLFVSVERLN